MTVEYDSPPPALPNSLLWDGRFLSGELALRAAWGLTPDAYQPLFGDGSYRWIEAQDGDRLALTTNGSTGVRLNSPSLFGGGGEYWAAMHLNAPLSPARETTMVANVGGVLLELSDSAGVLSMSTDEKGAPGTPIDWDGGKDHLLVVHALMSDLAELGYLTVELDGAQVASGHGVTWNQAMPRAWMVSILNVRDDVASGGYSVVSRGAVVGNSHDAVTGAFA